MQTNSVTSHRKAGRPIDTEKTAKIIAASKSLFFENGFDAVTIEQIATEASVAKTTIYSKFGSKEGVFQAVLDDISEIAESEMETGMADGKGEAQVLNVFGTSLVQNLTQPALIVAEPMILMRARRDPSLGQRFYENGPGRAITYLTDWISSNQSQGALVRDERAEDMAETLLGLWIGVLHHKLRLSQEPSPTQDEVRTRVRQGTRKFLKLYQKA